MMTIFKGSLWIILQAFCDVTSKYPKGMMGMLAELQIPHTGRHHSGIGNVHQNPSE